MPSIGAKAVSVRRTDTKFRGTRRVSHQSYMICEIVQSENINHSVTIKGRLDPTRRVVVQLTFQLFYRHKVCVRACS